MTANQMGDLSTTTVASSDLNNQRQENSNELLTVLIPAYNEDEVICLMLEELELILQRLSMPSEILIVDDGSSDRTVHKIMDCTLQTPLRIIRLSRNFGKEIALSAGLQHCTESSAVVIMDADGQHPPDLIPKFIDAWYKGYDDIYAIRQARDTDGWMRRQLTRLFFKLLPNDIDCIEHNVGDFRLLSAKVVQALNAMPEKNRFMKGLYSWVGFKKYSYPYTHRQRMGGNTKFTFRVLLSFAITGITAFSVSPLKLIARLGFIISAISIGYGTFITLRTVILGVDLPGWATLTAGITLLSGIQLISIGVLGEYIGRIFIESKDRPLYLVQEVINKNNDKNDSK